MPSATHSSTIFLNSVMSMIPCLRSMSSRGQNTHFALQMFVLSIWTISGSGASSRSVASSTRLTRRALRLRTASAPVRA